MAENIEPGSPRAKGPGGIAWSGGWLAMLALPLWMTHLSAAWLLVSAAGAVAWTMGVASRGNRRTVSTVVAVWAAIGVAGGVQARLGEIAADWPALQRGIEERSATALNEALDDLVERGERAAAGVDAAMPDARATIRVRPLFERLEALRETGDVSALAVFGEHGVPLAWAGEHRGAIPLAARLGREPYVFHEGPLFKYLYFTRPLGGGRTAVASVLLESAVEADQGSMPFAERFAERLGIMPRFVRPTRASGETVWDWTTDRAILSVAFGELSQQGWWERVVERGRRVVGGIWVLGLVLLSAAWYATRRGTPGVPVAVGTAALVLAPLGEVVGTERLFSPLQFVLPAPADVTLGVLLILLLGASVWTLTRAAGPTARRALPLPLHAVFAALLFTGVLELIDRSASTGLLAGTLAGGLPLQLATTLLVAIPLYFLLRLAPATGAGGRWAMALFAVGVALLVALGLWLIVWWLPGRVALPWTAALWAVPFAMLVASAPSLGESFRGLRAWLLAGLVAVTVTLPHLWVMHAAAELENAEVELAALGTEPDPFLDYLLRQFADRAATFATAGETGVNLLYHSWVDSGLAAEGHEAHLTLWRNGRADAQLALSRVDSLPDLVPELVAAAGPASRPTVRMFSDHQSLHYLLLAPMPDGRIVSVAVPPRIGLGRGTALARFLRPERASEDPRSNQTLYLVPAAESDTVSGSAVGVTWTRTEAGWRSEARARFPSGLMHAHLFVRTQPLPLVLVRGALGAVVITGTLLALWLVARLLCGELGALRRARLEWLRSFRGRLTATLFLFFLFPTAVFGAVAYGAVAREVVLSAAAYAQRTLEQAAPAVLSGRLQNSGGEAGADLLIYQHGLLVGAASPEILDLGLFHSWLSPGVFLDFATGEDTEAQENRRLGESEYLVAYRRLDESRVLAAPIPLAAQEITRRQTEFRDIALLVSLLGAALSIFLSLLVARALSRPLAELSRAAVTVGSGDLRVRLPESQSDEFGSVYRSFNRMVQRLRRARADLAREARRTETIVAEAATGVLALDAEGRVELVNPRAAEILGADPARGARLPTDGAVPEAIAQALQEFRGSTAAEVGRELEIDGRIIRLRLRRLTAAGGSRGTVVALEDVTSEVRTARVLAWGEMARQVAHEIKNPLTPIKLSVQHLRRAYADRRPDFEQILDRNVGAVLEEIERLGDIARAFARFGAPQQAQVQLEDVDVTRAIQEVFALYRGGGTDGIHLALDLPDDRPLHATARAGELKEVLINLLENAREALDGEGEVRVSAAPAGPAGRLEIVVADTGEGILPELLPRIFEPHFSTRTSGTGLGLAIVKRLVESWGGRIEAESEPGTGTTVRILLRESGPAAEVG